MSLHFSLVNQLVVCCLTLGLSGVDSTCLDESTLLDTDESLWRITAAGIFESLDQSQLKCEFTYQRGVAMSPIDAENAKFVNNTGENTIGDMATGLLVKKNNFARYRLTYNTPTGFRLEGRTGYSLASRDVSGGQAILVVYYPKQENTDKKIVGGDGSVLREDRAKNWFDIRMFGQEIEFSGLRASLILPNVMPVGGFKATVAKQSRVLSQTDTELVFEVESDDAEVITVHVNIRTEYPTVTQINTKTQKTQFSEFKLLDSGVSFPQRAVTVVGPYGKDGANPFWIGHIWQATTLVSTVTVEDFNVVFDQVPERSIPERIVNVTKLPELRSDDQAFDNVLPPIITAAESNDAVIVESFTGGRSWTIVLVVVIIVVSFSVILLFRRSLPRKLNLPSVFLFIVPVLMQMGWNTESQSGFSGTRNESNILSHSWDTDKLQVRDLGIVYTTPGDPNIRKVSFSYKNQEDSRVYVKIAGTSCSCVDVSVNGDHTALLDPLEECEISVTVELPLLREDNFVQSASVYTTNLTTQERTEQQYGVIARVFPKLCCSNLPLDSEFYLNESGMTMLRLAVHAPKEIVDPIHADYNQEKLIIELNTVTAGLDQDIHYRIVDALIQRRENRRSSLNESVKFEILGSAISVNVRDMSFMFRPSKRSVFFRSEGMAESQVTVDLIEGIRPDRIDFNDKFISLDVTNSSPNQLLLTINRRVNWSFSTDISLWIPGNNSGEADLVIPVNCL